MQNDHFNEEEVKEVLGRSAQLIKHGYLTGISLIKSQTPLPTTSVTVHYNQNSRVQVNHVASSISAPNLVLPRRTSYVLDPTYINKESFAEEYKDAEFRDLENLDPMAVEGVIQSRKPVLTTLNELDLLVPLENYRGLDDIVSDIVTADRQGPRPFQDPAIIIRSAKELPPREGFSNKTIVSLTRRLQEFYSVVSDEERKKALQKYLEKICPHITKGNLKVDAVVFHPSQINNQLLDYMKKMQRDLEEI